LNSENRGQLGGVLDFGPRRGGTAKGLLMPTVSGEDFNHSALSVSPAK
jgi:hypothetical protein